VNISPPAALAGVRICDLSGQLAGAGATRFLAAFGAEVIRVEDPVRKGQWDILRGSPPYRDGRRGIELGGAFNNHNVGKSGVTINLKTEEGRQLLRDLVACSDVVTENFAAGVMDRLGFGYDQLRELRPDIVYVSNSGFGHTGPYATYKSFGPVVQAVCGLTFGAGLPDRPPAGWGFSYMDHQGANFMAIAVLAALIHRHRTGEGQWIDMSCTEAGATLLGPALLDATVNGRPARRAGQPDSTHSRSPLMVPHAIYPAAELDSWVAIACRDDQDWAALAAILGNPWDAESLTTTAARLACEDALDAAIANWTAQHHRAETVAVLRARGIPAALVATPADRVDHDANADSWGLWPEVDHPDIGRVRVDGVPVHLSTTDWSIDRPAPRLGQHNADVLGGLLGRTDDDLADYAAKGVI
jgi:crotonobetainyl-CoA:carnitine CoA-transferase CaiB-like acyl-CoA transferase